MKYPISFWNTVNINEVGPEEADMWRDLGITVAMSPSCGADDVPKMTALLDRAYKNGIKVIICDDRAGWRELNRLGEEKFREGFAAAARDYGSHPAAFGFFVGDEPDAPEFEHALAASRIENEMAPSLVAYLNLLPWFDWIGERMGTPALAPYLDRAVRGGDKLLSYDCYAQMWGERGYKDYFHNLWEYYREVVRGGVPFWNIVLSSGHYEYRSPTKADLRWQLGTSAACGAAGVSWFLLRSPGVWENNETSPINALGDRTDEFGWLSEVNRLFNAELGEVLTGLTIDALYMAGKTWAEIPLFEPFDELLEAKSNRGDAPLIVSHFHDASGKGYYMVCVNTPFTSAYVSLKFKAGVKLSRCGMGGKFSPVGAHTDPVGEKDAVPGESVGMWMMPGQTALLRAD